MPRRPRGETVLSIWTTELSKERQIFLSFTEDCRLGPGIAHTGDEPEHMEFAGAPSPVTRSGEMREGWHGASRTWLVGQPNVAGGRLCKDPLDQDGDHCSYFHYLTDGRWPIVAMQSCGNLTMNDRFFGFYNPGGPSKPGDPKAYANPDGRAPGILHVGTHPPDEHKRYPCFLKWQTRDGPRYTIQEVRFFPNQPANVINISMDEVSAELDIHAQGRPAATAAKIISLVHHLEFAVSGKQVIKNRRAVPLQSIADQFDDMRHLFSLPELEEGRYWIGKYPNPWKPWFGEYQLLSKDQATLLRAFGGPVILDCGYAGLAAERDRVISAFKNVDYVLRQPTEMLTRPGHFRAHPNPELLEVWLRPNVYPFSFVALLQPRDKDPVAGRPSNIFAFLAVGGTSGREGLTLQQAVDILLTQVTFENEIFKPGGKENEKEKAVFTVADALLIDQGLDVFQFADGKFRVPVDGADQLPKEGDNARAARGRDRIRAVFIAAERRQDGAAKTT